MLHKRKSISPRVILLLSLLSCSKYYPRWKSLTFLPCSAIYYFFNPLCPDGSYMIHGSYGRNNCPETKRLVDNANFLLTKKVIRRLNADRPVLIHQLQPFGSRAIISSIRPTHHIWSIQTQAVKIQIQCYFPEGIQTWISHLKTVLYQ